MDLPVTSGLLFEFQMSEHNLEPSWCVCVCVYVYVYVQSVVKNEKTHYH